MAKTLTPAEESKRKDFLSKTDSKSKPRRKVKQVKPRQINRSKIVIVELLGDFSAQTGSYF